MWKQISGEVKEFQLHLRGTNQRYFRNVDDIKKNKYQKIEDFIE